jgi:hypothetical protein
VHSPPILNSPKFRKNQMTISSRLRCMDVYTVHVEIKCRIFSFESYLQSRVVNSTISRATCSQRRQGAAYSLRAGSTDLLWSECEEAALPIHSGIQRGGISNPGRQAKHTRHFRL